VRALYKQLTGEELDTRHDCIQQSSTFPGVVAIGHFAHDDGCRYEQVLVDCQLDPPQSGSRVLTKAGWRRADTARRVSLARAWLTEGEGVLLLPRDPEPEAAVATSDGGLRLRYWVAGRTHKGGRLNVLPTRMVGQPFHLI